MPDSFECEVCREEVLTAPPYSVCRQCGTTYVRDATDGTPVVHSSPERALGLFAILLLAAGIGSFIAERNSLGIFCIFLGFCLKLFSGLRTGVISIYLGRRLFSWTVYRTRSPEWFAFGILIEGLWVAGSLLAFLFSL